MNVGFAFLLLFCVLCFCNSNKRLPVIVVDFGSEFIKTSLLVYDTSFFELVLNEQSSRKSDSIIAFSNDNKRLYSILAKAMVRRSKNSFFLSLKK